MKTFKPYNPDQLFLLPPALRDWLPEGHLALFASDVVDALDLAPILATSADGDGRGQPPYHPALVVKLLVHGDCTGQPSSRRIEKAAHEEVLYRILAADQHPDHDSLAASCQQHLSALAGLFTRVLALCQRAGLVSLGHVGLDGTKVLANASEHKAMSHGRMGEAERQPEQEVAALLAQAAQVDAAKDAQYGKGRGGRTPGRARPAHDPARQDPRGQGRPGGGGAGGSGRSRGQGAGQAGRAGAEGQNHRPEAEGPAAAGPGPHPHHTRRQGTAELHEPRVADHQGRRDQEFRAGPQRPGGGGRRGAQIIVAAAVTQEADDKQQLVPLLTRVVANGRETPAAASADSGYFSEAAATADALAAIDLCVAPGRQKHGEDASPPVLDDGTVIGAMRAKLQTAAGHVVYALRKAIAEPAFGQITDERHFRRFSFRGLVKVRAERLLICLTHNLLKLFRVGWTPHPA